MIKLNFVLFFILFPILLIAQNGIVKTYYASGKVESRVSFVKEVLEGTSYWYYENGNIKTEKNYSNGKLNGLVRNYYENGLLKDETHIEDGVLSGVYRSFYENGALHQIKNYEYGQLLSVNTLEYDPNYIAPLTAYNAGKKKQNIDSNDFICSVEICPEPVGGIEEIESNIEYPKLAKQFGLEGNVLLSVTISKKGIPSNIKVIKELGLGCSEAAVAAVGKTMFIPGRNKGEEVEANVTFSLNFILDNDKQNKIVNSQEVTSLRSDSLSDNLNLQNNFISCDIDKCPEPIGGITELLKILRYPAQAKRNNISGNVVIKAKVNEIGFVISAEVIKSLGYGCDEAAKSAVIKTQFYPGQENGADTESTIEITVPFISTNQ